MRLALWTPRLDGWIGVLASHLGRTVEVAHLPGPGTAAGADLSVYHLADRPEHGFVYRALRDEPGLVILDDWNLHSLVHAECAARGALHEYRREARRDRGPVGSFVAEQVIRGWAGALPSLVPLNERVLAASLCVLTRDEAVHARGRQRLGEPLVVLLPPDAAASASVLLRRAGEVLPSLPGARRALEMAHAEQATLVGAAMGELRPFAREVGLGGLPDDIRPLLARLFADERRA